MKSISQTSLHTRLVWSLVVVAATALAVCGTLLFILQEKSLENRTQASLEEVEHVISRLALEGVDRRTGKPFATPTDLLYHQFRTNVLGRNEAQLGFKGDQVALLPAADVDFRPENDPELVAKLASLAVLDETTITSLRTQQTEYRIIVIPVKNEAEHAALAHIIDYRATTADLRYAILVFALTAFGIVTSVMGVAWVSVKRLLKPIEELRNAAENIHESDLTSRVPQRSQDDLGLLAGAFNRMLDRVETSVTEQKKLLTSQRNLLNDVGHELRTPITIVRGHLELADENDPVDVAETKQLAIDELDRMSLLVNDILLLAKSAQSDFINPVPTDIADLTEQVFAKAKGLCNRTWNLETVAETEVELDASRITQAWLQLVSNAVKYSPPEKPIAIGSAVVGNQLRMWVKDQGIGIDPSEVNTIMERFSRASNALNYAHGTGIGLNIVDSIVKAHQGRVIIQSRLGAGSTFIMQIPLTQ
ncbi:HAMP domain-containing histidine kinase [Gleimia sp. 6138-11-ORH1]|uniref:sensor histidine kinase n=1 Tax=Gleimia sp. 6138-11-ORH1 TaxID=2973937 RepID=UPI00216A6032|nr:HAMP domain-containing sensor histidine kinase [Gleimia sp. 6138-11-ORH1]MCS4484936.1 HAMP domain-containing histidine kinase [Gleimia sp. 6138-11-ORH1]